MDNVISYTEIQVLEKCQRLEEIAAEMYIFLARSCGFEPGLCALFGKTAQEEENHASQFSLAIRMRKGLKAEVKIGKQKLEESLNLAESVLQRMKSIPPTPRKALEDVIMLEEKFSEFHLVSSLDFPDESNRKLFHAMMSADQDHVGTLKKALANLKD